MIAATFPHLMPQQRGQIMRCGAKLVCKCTVMLMGCNLVGDWLLGWVLEGGGVPIAIVRCRPHSVGCVFKMGLVSFHDELVCPCHNLERVSVVELLNYISPKEVPSPSRAHGPPLHV
jgi:hypothetical protein